jgi:tight adherence protein C
MSVISLIVTVAVFVAVVAIFYALQTLFNPERTARDRVADLTQNRKDNDTGLLQNEKVTSVAQNIGSLARPGDEEEANLQRRQLIQAGFRARSNLEVFSAIRVICAATLPFALWLLVREKQLVFQLLTVLMGAATGYYAPGWAVSLRIGDRQDQLMRSIPDALDLLVSSVEAGLGLDAALRRVSQEMENAAPELAKELQMVNHEVAAGMPRLEALRRLDQRTGLKEINQLVNVLAQADRFGTSVATALRSHSELVRRRRMLAAEEQAGKVSPKLTVVTILFVMPSLIIVLIGPAVVNVVRTLLPAMGGQ